MNFDELTRVHIKEIKKETIILSKEVGKWCLRPYDKHPKGCPNYGKRNCPPNTLFFWRSYK